MTMLRAAFSIGMAIVLTGATAPPVRSTAASPGSASGSAASDPKAVPSPAPAAGSVAGATTAQAEFEADQRLAERLRPYGADASAQSRACIGLAWNPDEPDVALRAAARRRLAQTNPRAVADALLKTIGTAPPSTRIGLLELMGEIYSGLGGINDSLNGALADQIRSQDTDVARTAISVCSQAGIAESYLPMRELATRPSGPLRENAILGLARLRDPRAVNFFGKLLDSGSAPRDEIYRALGEIGRPASMFLKSKLDDPDPAERRRAIDALLPIANADDLTSLYAYIQKYPPTGDLKTRLFDKIAAIEASQFETPLGQKD